MSTITSIALGGSHVLVLLKSGELLAWGSNQYGQLGNGSTRDAQNPVFVLEDIVAIAAGEFHSMAINDDGDLFVWGCNSSGQLGDGTLDHCASPKMIMEYIAEIWAGGSQSAALKKPPPSGLGRQSLWVWGMDVVEDGSERAAIANVALKPEPTQIWEDFNGGKAVVMMACGRNHTMLVIEDGSCLTWGRNGHGQLGDGTTRDRLAPLKVADGIQSVSAGLDFSLALARGGELLAWGCNGSGRLGTGDTVDRLLPTRVLQDVSYMSAGAYHAAALLSNDDCVGWGCNLHDCLAPGLEEEVLLPARLLDGVKQLQLGAHQSLALMASGGATSWGYQAAAHNEGLFKCQARQQKQMRTKDDALASVDEVGERDQFKFSEERYIHPPLEPLFKPKAEEVVEAPKKKKSPKRKLGQAVKLQSDWVDGGPTAPLEKYGEKGRVKMLEKVHQKARQNSRSYAVRWAAFRREADPEASQDEQLVAFHASLCEEVTRFRQDQKRLNDISQGGWTTEHLHPVSGVMAMAEALEAVVKEVMAMVPPPKEKSAPEAS